MRKPRRKEVRKPKRKGGSSRRQSPRTVDNSTWNYDGQIVPLRCTRGRKTKFMRRVLRAFELDGESELYAWFVIAGWTPAEHQLFWDLCGYDGSNWDARHGLPGMIGESKRVLAEMRR